MSPSVTLALTSLTIITTTFLWTAVCCQKSHAETYSSILRYLYSVNLDKRARPVKNGSTIINASVNFFLMTVFRFDMVTQTLYSSGYLEVKWHNEYTTWDPQMYEGIKRVTVDQDMFWKPALTLQNTVKELKPMSTDYGEMFVYSTGDVLWYLPSVFETKCSAEVFFYPFDTQTCRWQILVWDNIDKSVGLNTEKLNIGLNYYDSSGEWDLLQTKGRKMVRAVVDYQEDMLVYEVTLKRRPVLISLTLILPVLLLGLLNVFVFTIPPQLGGERLSYSLTVLLSFGVFYGYVVDALPSATDVVPLAVIMLSGHIIFSALYVMFCVLSIRLYHKDQLLCPVPASLQAVVLFLEHFLCLGSSTALPQTPACHSKVETILTDFDADRSQREMNTGQDEEVVHGLEEHTRRVKTLRHCRARDKELKETPADNGTPEEIRKKCQGSRKKTVTWQHVSTTMDAVLFGLFGSLLLAGNVITVATITWQLESYVKHESAFPPPVYETEAL